MAEEMADHLQKRGAKLENKQSGAQTNDGEYPVNVDTLENLTIGQVFDTEAVTYSRLRQTSDYLSEEISSDEEEEDDYISEDDWESFESKESGLDGVKKNGETVVSKHDKELSQRKNAKRIMEFPPGLDIRDGGGGAQVRLELSSSATVINSKVSIQELMHSPAGLD